MATGQSACTLYPALRNSGLVASVATSCVQSTANVAASNSASVARLKLSVGPKPLPDAACVLSGTHRVRLSRAGSVDLSRKSREGWLCFANRSRLVIQRDISVAVALPCLEAP